MKTEYFLGANSPRGFYSLYDGFIDPKRDELRIIKSGPGSGKSTFMRIIAEKAEKKGLETELIRCSGDPGSLDGVYIPELHIAYTDGTSPHVQEPVYHGIGGRYVDLSDFYDSEGLRRERDAIIRLTAAYKAKYSRAYKLIESAKCAHEALSPVLTDDEKRAGLRRLDGILTREIPESGKGGSVKRRFLGAISCEGFVELYDTVKTLCDRVYLFDNDLSMGFDAAERCAERAESAGWDTVRLMSWFSPERCAGVIVPELRVAFIARDRRVPYPCAVCRTLRLDAAASSMARAEQRAADKLTDAVLDRAVIALREAKSLHDKLEEHYNPYVDFDGVRSLAMRECDAIFG